MPVYDKLKNDIRKQIREGKYPAGTCIPSESHLSKKYNISRFSVREALTGLVSEGLLYKAVGRGTVVKEFSPEFPVQGKDIAFVLCNKDVVDPHFSRVLKGVEKEAFNEGYSVVYLNLDSTLTLNEFESKLSSLMSRKNLEGIIVTGEKSRIIVDSLKNRKKPLVLIGDIFQKEITENDLEVIAHNDYQGGYMAAKHLADLGHKEIGLITEPLNTYARLIRKKGYEDALKEKNIPVKQEYVIECGENKEDNGYGAMKRILDEKTKMTAFFVCNDRHVLGCYRAIKERGLKIPGDFSIAAFGGFLLSEELDPPLTTVRVELEKSGELAVSRLIYIKEHPNTKFERHVFDVELMEKESCKCLK